MKIRLHVLFLTVAAAFAGRSAFAQSLSVTASPTSIPANGTSMSNVTVTATSSSTTGTVSMNLLVLGPGTVSPSAITIPLSSGTGIGNATLQSTTTPGTVTVIASAPGFTSGSASVVTTAILKASSISASASPSSIARGQTSQVSAIVKDQYGNPMSGQTVAFSLGGLGSLSPSSAATNGAGAAGTAYVAPANFGGSSITAQITSCVNGTTLCATTNVAVHK